MKTAIRIAVVTALFAILFIGGGFAKLASLVALGLVGVREFKEAREAKAALCDAHIYKHLELGTLLYCDEEQATHSDYQYLGTAKVKCENVNSCSLA